MCERTGQARVPSTSWLTEFPHGKYRRTQICEMPADAVPERSDVRELPKVASLVPDVTTQAGHRGDLCDGVIDRTPGSQASMHGRRICTWKVLLLGSKGRSRTLAALCGDCDWGVATSSDIPVGAAGDFGRVPV